MADAAIRDQPSVPNPSSLATRFWSIARSRNGTGVDGDSVDPVAVVRHVLAVLRALGHDKQGPRGHLGASSTPVSVRTLSFLKLLRESEQRGDLNYAAPEQISGEMLDEHSLVFSVGVLLFERLTGRHPFRAEGNSVRRVARIRKGEFGSGINYFPTVPSALRTILMKAMGPFPEERFNSLSELRTDLKTFAEKEARDQLPLPGTTAPRSARQPKRKPASDRESTRIVDMSSQIERERDAANERIELERRKRITAAGSIEMLEEDSQADTREIAAAPTSSEADLLPALAPVDYVPNLKARAPAGIKPLLWAGVGASVATVVLLLLWSGDSTSGGSAAPANTALAASTSLQQQPSTPANHKTVGTEAHITPAVIEALRTFDPEQAGADAIRQAATCLTARQRSVGVSFGIGILFDDTDGHVRKVYFSGDDSELPLAQRRCVRRSLATFAVSPPPERRRVVDYFARIRGDTSSVRIHEPTPSAKPARPLTRKQKQNGAARRP